MPDSRLVLHKSETNRAVVLSCSIKCSVEFAGMTTAFGSRWNRLAIVLSARCAGMFSSFAAAVIAVIGIVPMAAANRAIGKRGDAPGSSTHDPTRANWTTVITRPVIGSVNVKPS